MSDRPVKITFAEMHVSGVRGILVYCPDYKCSHSVALNAYQWADISGYRAAVRLQACGKRGADVRPDFHWQGAPKKMMGFR